MRAAGGRHKASAAGILGQAPSALLALCLLGCPSREPAPVSEANPRVPFADWSYRASTDVSGPTGYRFDIRDGASLYLTTTKTDPATVKVHGIMSPYAWSWPAIRGEAISINTTLDWIDHPNASYLSMDIVLARDIDQPHPLAAPDTIRFAYVGVPPLRNARALLEERRKGRLRQHYTEGFPEANKTGRAIARTAITLRLGPEALELIEDGQTLHKIEPYDPPLKEGRIFLLQTGHSNYPTRTVKFSEPMVVED